MYSFSALPLGQAPWYSSATGESKMARLIANQLDTETGYQLIPDSKYRVYKNTDGSNVRNTLCVQQIGRRSGRHEA
jgi:hypothetical protein